MKGLMLAISLFLTLYSLCVGSVFAQSPVRSIRIRTLLAAMEMAGPPSPWELNA